MEKNIDWSIFESSEIKIKKIEFKNMYEKMYSEIEKYIKQLDKINIEYINATNELKKRGEE